MSAKRGGALEFGGVTFAKKGGALEFGGPMFAKRGIALASDRGRSTGKERV